jgi:hypothetical protein
LPSDSLESVFNPHASSHGLAGAEPTRPPLNALTSNQKDNCNARSYRSPEISGTKFSGLRAFHPDFDAPAAAVTCCSVRVHSALRQNQDGRHRNLFVQFAWIYRDFLIAMGGL